MNRLAADTLHTEVLPMIASIPTVLLRVIRKVRIVVIVATQRRTAPKKALMILMMMRWTRLGRIGNGALCVRER